MVEVKNLWVRYGKYEAVKGISFTIPKGEVFGFIGPNGAGKSSTIKVLATLQREYECDAVKINGVSVHKAPHLIREMIGYMPDFFGVYEDLTAREYLHFFAAAYRINRSRRKAIVDDVLELTDLTAKIDSPVDSLSRGMKQRLALARVLLHDPDLLLLDEPASGLDPRARIEVRELLVALKEMGKTIIISSHILHELSQLCTSIGIIEAGQFVTQGSLDQIYKRLELSRVVHVQIVGEMNGICQQIEQFEGVKSVSVQADRLAIQLQEDQMAVDELHARLAATGARIRMFQAEAMDMETVFMKLTEGKTA
ncbi:putative ABC transporter ATP-binding protein YbhF [Gimesia chilikensis]|jgi:ABC-2 type transport system ATP-binding protein|uniref:Putative ABC transporter ATP-binding protein YbhF n=2 Tax=Gimesia chilikensis TaxID=2605989 RepID=A0A517PPG7_9PLAN|nr:putative ABC transporter ATP-binding protein YbhF [Gimesia chilikensis]QDT84292.1 putative ABC transporter ATP-binding protein YbhF [Gimesia chilikensis]